MHQPQGLRAIKADNRRPSMVLAAIADNITGAEVADKRRCLAQDGPGDSLSAILTNKLSPCGGAQESSSPELGRWVELTLQDAGIGELLLTALVPGPTREASEDPLARGESPVACESSLGRSGLRHGHAVLALSDHAVIGDYPFKSMLPSTTKSLGATDLLRGLDSSMTNQKQPHAEPTSG